MSHNSFGRLFRVTSFGESHGRQIGCVIDGTPPGLPLDAGSIQYWLDRRRPGMSRFTTQRREPDTVRIESGIFQGKTTGMPIALIIDNVDARSKDYSELSDRFRPGHADFTWHSKYGLRDYRGGGRSSARETACRVAAGAVARLVLGENVTIKGGVVALGGVKVKNRDWGMVETNPFWSPDADCVETWASMLDEMRRLGDSLGAVIEIHAEGVPAGWGAPVYGKLDSDLAGALMSINATKSVEIGDGLASSARRGSEDVDEILPPQSEGETVSFASNHAGGILGGISTGEPIIARFAVKPTSSIRTVRRSVDLEGRPVEISTRGRHDPCVGIRAVPVGEAMMACVLADHKLRHRAQCG